MHSTSARQALRRVQRQLLSCLVAGHACCGLRHAVSSPTKLWQRRPALETQRAALLYTTFACMSFSTIAPNAQKKSRVQIVCCIVKRPENTPNFLCAGQSVGSSMRG